jgi:hypothetical protein
VPIPEDERRKDERRKDERLNDGRVDHDRIHAERIDDQSVTDRRITDQRINDQRINDQLIDDQLINDQPVNDPPIDEKFEAHLKQFRPLAPQPLPVDSHIRAPRRWFVLVACAATAAAVVAVAGLAFHARPGRIAPPVESFAITDQLAKPQSLTIGTANALLARAPSFKDAIDGIAFPTKTAPLPADKHSALAELSKEKIKL